MRGVERMMTPTSTTVMRVKTIQNLFQIAGISLNTFELTLSLTVADQLQRGEKK